MKIARIHQTMDGRGSNRFPTKQEDQEPGVTSDNSGEFPFSGAIREGKMTCSASSPKRSRRSVQKRVVSIPISDVHGSRLKGGDGAPPSDSWAWRKYGQKPIKGSPYPRGYYRCSSSKGCPARKQVERSRADPTMLVVTYACEHNHPGLASRNLPTKTKTKTTTTTSTPTLTTTSPKEEEPTTTTVFTTEDKFRDLGGGNDVLISSDDFTWFSDVASSTSDVTLLESPIYGRGGTSSSGLDADVAMIFGEEDESLFADLGELPECSVVFRRGCIEQQQQEERRRCTLRAG